MTGMDYDPGTFRCYPPQPGCCPICAFFHGKNEPHFPGSTYYIMRFFQDHGRRPTWKDAMAHCPPEIQEAWTKELMEHGAIPREDSKADGG